MKVFGIRSIDLKRYSYGETHDIGRFGNFHLLFEIHIYLAQQMMQNTLRYTKYIYIVTIFLIH